MTDRGGAGAVAVIDDDDAVRDSLGALLEAEGYAVAPYPSGRAFLDALPEGPPACALVDVRMPEMDGLELQRRLAEAAPQLPVIIITGHGDIAMAVRAIKAGAIDFIEKPFTDRTILDGIAQALASREEALSREARRRDIGRRAGAPDRARARGLRTARPAAIPTRPSPACWASARARSRCTGRVSWRSCRHAACRTWCAWP